MSCSPSGVASISAASLRSIPEQNAAPAPVTTTARIARFDADLSSDVAELGEQLVRQCVAPIGAIEGQDRDRAAILADQGSCAHRVQLPSDGSPGSAGNVISRRIVPSALPCVSSRNERLAPPARACSITKLNAWIRGSS